MDSLVEKEKMQILATGLIKGFTILEILIVLAIISISGTSFYLILQQEDNFDDFESTFSDFKVLSLYSGNTYAFTKDSIKILNEDIWEELESIDFSDVYSVTNNVEKTTIVEDDEIFLVISPGNEISIKSITLSGGKIIEL